MKEVVIRNLEKFSFNYSEQNDKVLVQEDYSLQMLIDFSNPDKVKIDCRLKGFNWIIWPFELSLKGLMLYQVIGSTLAAILLILWSSYGMNSFILTMIFLFGMFLNLLWTIYYIVKAEFFKLQVLEWISR